MVCLLALAPTVRAAEVEYPREVARWQGVSVPSDTDHGSRMVWSCAASYSRHEWRVYTDGDQICAQQRLRWTVGRSSESLRCGCTRERTASGCGSVLALMWQ